SARKPDASTVVFDPATSRLTSTHVIGACDARAGESAQDFSTCPILDKRSWPAAISMPPPWGARAAACDSGRWGGGREPRGDRRRVGDRGPYRHRKGAGRETRFDVGGRVVAPLGHDGRV